MCVEIPKQAIYHPFPMNKFMRDSLSATALDSDDTAGPASIPTLQEKKIKIAGRIELCRGKPEIKVLLKSQITEE